MPKINPALVKGEKVKKTLTPEHLDKLQKARQLYQKTRQEERQNKIIEPEKVETDIIETTPIKEEDKEIDETEIKAEIKPILEVEQETIFNEKKDEVESLDDKIIKHIQSLKIKKKKKEIILSESSSSDEEVVYKKIKKHKIKYVEKKQEEPVISPMAPSYTPYQKPFNLFDAISPVNQWHFNNSNGFPRQF